MIIVSQCLQTHKYIMLMHKYIILINFADFNIQLASYHILFDSTLYDRMFQGSLYVCCRCCSINRLFSYILKDE